MVHQPVLNQESLNQTTKAAECVCPNCGHQGLNSFFEVRQVPVHSCLMLASEQEALDFPVGDVVLAYCPSCGFVTNTEFDAKWSAYAPNYEDQQSYSPTFNQFALKLGNRLIDTYDLHGKKIIEIGCSKGDFLLMMCEQGNNSGVGIDPSVVPGRVNSEAAERVEFVKAYYSREHAKFEGDFICCRHTLEHIQPTQEFVQTVRDSTSGNLNTPVLFEIPDTIRVLKEAAFEDIYYEHCSYFTPGSLARLFRSCNFEVNDLYLDYGDQYLFIEATPTAVASSKVHPLEESVEETIQYIEQFKTLITKKLDWWRNQLNTWQQAGDKVVVWGSGSKCVSFLTTLNTIDKIQYVVDINPHRHGKFIPGVGKEIKSPEFLQDYAPDRIIIMNAIYRPEIEEMLEKMNVKAEVIALGDELKHIVH
jgi:hypothetical protein